MIEMRIDEARWQQLDIRQQIGHITSEIARAKHWEEKKDAAGRNQALGRALDLLDKTLKYCAAARRHEIARFREVTAHCYVQSPEYDILLEDLESYGLSHL